MTILNEKTNNIKTREIKNISCVYTTKTNLEKINDIILIDNLSFNTILKSIRLTTSNNMGRLVVDVILLDRNKEEITYLSDSTTKILKPLATNVSLTTVIKNSEQLKSNMKFQTLEEYIVSETKKPNYLGQVFLALKITTAPTTPNIKILAETDFIENI